ncbi:MAG: hypothetical protein K6A80_07275 [Saccharofermentans sp.]|nr:hypothetical protein [Saccharofermentans sp.]
MNTKKIIAGLLALSLAAAATGCKYEIELETEATESSVISSETSVEDTAIESSESSEATEATAASFEEGPVTDQILSFAEHTDKWFQSSEFDQFYYCVTDLDRDGGLELFAATSSGSGDYTFADVYLADNVDVRECQSNMGDGDFYPNIIVDNGTPITFFIEDGKASYIYYFNHSSGDLETSSGISVVSFSQESIEVLDLCMRNESNGVVTFKDCLTGESIDEAAYNAFLGNYLSGKTTSEAHFQWITIDDPSDCSSALMLSYNGFSN